MSAPQPICPKRLAANRANAQLSTGPTTSEGKAKSSLNAVKTGLTGRTVLLPNEDAAAYQSHVERFGKELQPVGERETQLVQSIADTQWRLDRIPGLEFGLFALGHKRYADLFEDETDGQVRRALLDAHILMTEAKHFKNLHLGEEAEELARLREKTATRAAAATNGFEFTNSAEPGPAEQKKTDHYASASADRPFGLNPAQ